MSFIKKTFIYKEKCGTITKLKEALQAFFATMVLALHCYCGDNI